MTTNLTLNGWKLSVATGVVEAVPLQTLESALVMADDFLGTQGGWVPDDEGDPTGTGQPASGVSLQDAILIITINARDRIYRSDITGALNFRVIQNNNLAPGLSDDAVLQNLVDILNDFVQQNLERTNIEFIDIPSYTGAVTNGPTTTGQRQEIQQTLLAGGQIIDPWAIGLSVARAEYNLDTTWNVQYLYTEPSKVLFVMVIKYTDDLYETVDTTATNRFGITLDATSYRTTGGTTLPPEVA